MKFKKGDVIKSGVKDFATANKLLFEYEVKEIANGDLFADKYYVLSDTSGKRTYLDQEYVDHLFTISVKHVLKNL